MGTQLGGLECNGNIHIANLIALFADKVDGALQKDGGVDTFVGHIGVGEKLAYVAKCNRTKQSIAQGVDGNVAVRMGNTSHRGGHLHTAQHKV